MVISRFYATLLLGLLVVENIFPSNFSHAQSSTYLIDRGNQNFKIGNTKAAIEAYEKALSVEPANEEASKKLALAYENSGRLERAIDLYKRHLEKHPNDADTAFRLAKILQWQRFGDQRQEVIRYLRQGLSIKESPEMRVNLARVLGSRRESISDAKREYEKILVDQPHRPDLRSEYLKILMWDPKYRDQAIDELRQHVKNQPDDLLAKRKLANLLAVDRGRAGESLDIFSELIEKSPEDLTLRKERLMALMKIPQEKDLAKKEVQEILKKRPEAGMRIYYADLLASDPSSLREARTEYREILNSNPGNRDVRIKYGKLLLAKGGDPKEAIQQFKRALKQDPENITAHRGLAQAYAMTGESDLALYHTSRAKSSDGRDDPELQQMTSDINLARRPRAYLQSKIFFNRSGAKNLLGHTSQIGYQGELGPFITLRGGLGVEEYSDSRGSAADVVGSFGLQIRATNFLRLSATSELRNLNNQGSSLSGEILACALPDRFFICPGYEIRPIYDSVTAFRGRNLPSPQKSGGARDVFFKMKAGANAEGFENYSVTLERGYVQSYSSDSNPFLRITAEAREQLLTLGEIRFDAAATVRFMTYERDELEATPSKKIADEYFSPKQYYLASGRLIVGTPVEKTSGVDISIGPLVRYYETYNKDPSFEIGKTVTLGLWREELSENWNLRFESNLDSFPSSEISGRIFARVSRLF